MQSAIFLDRDGVIIENRPDKILAWEDIEIFPGALQALTRIRTCPQKIIIVTYQPVVGMGLISLNEAWEINKRLIVEIQQAGGRIDGVFMCPHSPEEQCNCCKPQPGLLIQAANCLNIDLKRSIVISETCSCLAAGEAAGIQRTILLREENVSNKMKTPDDYDLVPSLICNCINDALTEFFH